MMKITLKIMTKKDVVLLLSLMTLVCCGKHGPMERIEELQDQRSGNSGSIAAVAGKAEGLIFTFKGGEHTPSFSKTKSQKNLYENTLKLMQGYPYSVDPTGKTVYTDWFEGAQKCPTKITVLIQEKDIVVSVFTKRNGEAVLDKKKGLALESQIKDRA